jgi:hypothetical protein
MQASMPISGTDQYEGAYLLYMITAYKKEKNFSFRHVYRNLTKHMHGPVQDTTCLQIVLDGYL